MGEFQPNSENIEKWLKLIRADGVGPATFTRLVKHFGSIDTAVGAAASEMTRIDGIGPKTAEQIASSRDKFDVEDELNLAEKLGVWIIHIEDDRYPTVLKKTYDPPPVLYIKGSLSKNDNLSLSLNL